jgi:tetratricopeptide (TPR) repeat protein
MASKIPELRERATALHGECTDEVIEVNREILRLRPDDMAACNRLGIALLDRGEPEEARKVFEKGVAKNPENTIAKRRLLELDIVIPEKKRKRRITV